MGLLRAAFLQALLDYICVRGSHCPVLQTLYPLRWRILRTTWYTLDKVTLRSLVVQINIIGFFFNYYNHVLLVHQAIAVLFSNREKISIKKIFLYLSNCPNKSIYIYTLKLIKVNLDLLSFSTSKPLNRYPKAIKSVFKMATSRLQFLRPRNRHHSASIEKSSREIID